MMERPSRSVMLFCLLTLIGCDQPPDPSEGRQDMRRHIPRQQDRYAKRDSIADAIDVPYVWQDYNDEEFADTFRLDKRIVQREFNRYGMLKEDYERSYPSRAEEVRALQTGGFLLTRDNTVEIDYNQVFEHNREIMRDYAEEILALDREVDKQHDPVLALTSFVQYVPYKVPPDYTEAASESKFINGFFPPIVSLANGYGDCDTKSILLASMLASHVRTIAQGAVLFPEHMILGVAGDPLPGQKYLLIDGVYYILIETTGKGYTPGDLSPDVVQLVRDGSYRWIPLK